MKGLHYSHNLSTTIILNNTFYSHTRTLFNLPSVKRIKITAKTLDFHRLRRKMAAVTSQKYVLFGTPILMTSRILLVALLTRKSRTESGNNFSANRIPSTRILQANTMNNNDYKGLAIIIKFESNNNTKVRSQNL